MTTTTLYGRFKKAKAEHPDALILMRCGDFYETYEDDAKTIADITGITLTLTRKMREACRSYLRMAGFPHYALDTYLPRLIRAGYRVAIVDL